MIVVGHETERMDMDEHGARMFRMSPGKDIVRSCVGVVESI